LARLFGRIAADVRRKK
jgi:hypothetical protein